MISTSYWSPGIQRQVDNQGQDIARHQGSLDALEKAIAVLRNKFNNLSPSMERLDGVLAALYDDVKKQVGALNQVVAKQEALTANQEEVKKEIEELGEGVAKQEDLVAIHREEVKREIDELRQELAARDYGGEARWGGLGIGWSSSWGSKRCGGYGRR
jgi:chromosome segregation ATPase